MAVRTVVYGGNRLSITDDSLSVDQIKRSMSDIYPELANAEASVVGNEIHFKVKAGTKGATRTVVYGGNRLSITDDSLSVEQIKRSMADIYPELANAEATVVGSEIHFKVKAGTKGATRTVVYGGNRLSITDDSLTVDQIKRSMSDIYPELANAEATVVGSEIHFKVKAGTKGATRTVVYGGNRLSITDDALTPAEIQRSMADIYPELANATYEVVGSEIHFKVKAGTKGE